MRETDMKTTIRGIILALALVGGIAPLQAGEVTGSIERGGDRIVAIGGSVTEIVYALGEGDRLVARDSTSMWPEAAGGLPDVGYMRQLSPEGVLSVDPSAIIALEGSGPPEAMDVLRKASVPLVSVPERFDREGILEKIRIVGAALGAEGRAAELAEQVGRDVAAAEAAARTDAPPRVLFVLSLQGGKILASGSGTAADGIIAMAGARNVISEFAGYRQLSDEAVIEARPDVVLMMDRTGGPGVDDAALLAHPAIVSTPAGERGAVIRMDGSYLLGFGPRTAAAVRDLASRLAGGAG
jgi:iron complex transport system substrate-binding protein